MGHLPLLLVVLLLVLLSLSLSVLGQYSRGKSKSNGLLRRWRTAAAIAILLTWMPCLTGAEKAAERSEKPPEKTLRLTQAVAYALAYDPTIYLQKEQVEIDRGRAQEVSGQFDPQLDGTVERFEEHRPLIKRQAVLRPHRYQETQGTTVGAGVSKQFRSGISASLDAAIEKTDDPDDRERPENRGNVSFTIEVPLLRNRGKGRPGADEKAARLIHEASTHNLVQTISERVRVAAGSFWQYLAAEKALAIRRSSEERAQTLVRETRTLIEADEVPRAELERLLANLADKTADRIASEQAVVDERYALGLAVGVQAEEIAAIPPPADEFPRLREDALSGQPVTPYLVAQALERRDDLKALALRQESAKVLMASARHNLKPQLDLAASIGVSGLQEGSSGNDFYHGMNRGNSPVDPYASIGVTVPLGNNMARGLVVQRRSAYNRALIQTNDLTRTIASNVVLAVSVLRSRARELAKEQEAVRLYLKAVENEKEKRKLGTSTLIDVIETEDRLTRSLLNMIGQQSNYAIALIQLRFQTGTLISASHEDDTVTVEDLTSVPFAERKAKNGRDSK